MEHGLPLEFPINSSPETIGTRPNEGSTTFPHPSSLFLKREHEGRTIKDGQDSDRPHAHEARGLDRRKPNLEWKKTGHAMTQGRSLIERVKDLEGVKILHRGLRGYTRQVHSRAPPEKVTTL
jgi:hypothetical protein